MIEEKVIEALKNLLAEKEKSEIGLDGNIRNRSFTDLGLDSLDYVEFVMQLETIFNIDFSPADLRSVEYLPQLTAVIEMKKTTADAV